MSTFRDRLRDAIDYSGLTVKELSAKTGIKKRAIDTYVGVQESIPPVDVAVKLAQALNVTVEYLVGVKKFSKPEFYYDGIVEYYNSLQKNDKELILSLIKRLSKEKCAL